VGRASRYLAPLSGWWSVWDAFLIRKSKSARRWRCVEVDFRHSLKDLNESTTSSWVVRLSSHMGAEKHPTVGSSGEYWSMSGSLNQHYA